MYQAFGLTYLILFHLSALSNSRGAPCHCGLLFSLASISCNTGGLCLVQTETVSSPNKDKVCPEATVRGSGQNNHNYWRKGGEQGEPVPPAEPAAPQQLPGWLGSAVAEASGKEGSDGGPRAGAAMLS